MKLSPAPLVPGHRGCTSSVKRRLCRASPPQHTLPAPRDPAVEPCGCPRNEGVDSLSRHPCMVPARLVSTTAPDLTPHPPPHTCRTDAPPPCTTDLPPPPSPFQQSRDQERGAREPDQPLRDREQGGWQRPRLLIPGHGLRGICPLAPPSSSTLVGLTDRVDPKS